MKDKLLLWIPSAVLAGLIGFGSFQYYFKKPVPIVNNTSVQPGATLNVDQKQSKSDRFGIVVGPVYLGGKVGGFFGVEIKF